jgi:hypothetical protein
MQYNKVFCDLRHAQLSWLYLDLITLDEMLHQVQSLWRISGRSSKPMDFKCSKWQSPLLQIRIIMADFKFYWEVLRSRYIRTMHTDKQGGSTSFVPLYRCSGIALSTGIFVLSENLVCPTPSANRILMRKPDKSKRKTRLSFSSKKERKEKQDEEQ